MKIGNNLSSFSNVSEDLFNDLNHIYILFNTMWPSHGISICRIVKLSILSLLSIEGRIHYSGPIRVYYALTIRINAHSYNLF